MGRVFVHQRRRQTVAIGGGGSQRNSVRSHLSESNCRLRSSCGLHRHSKARKRAGPDPLPALRSVISSYGWLVGGTPLGFPPGALVGLPWLAGGPGVWTLPFWRAPLAR